jgi:hypothetical protein
MDTGKSIYALTSTCLKKQKTKALQKVNSLHDVAGSIITEMIT